MDSASSPTPSILVATWGDGLFRVTGDAFHQEISGGSVRGLTPDGRGGVLAIIDGRSLRCRTIDGQWSTVFEGEPGLSCCAAIGDAIFVGTDNARILRVDADGVGRWLAGFETVEGRETWYAGSAIVDGKVMGPPLGVRSMTATCDGAALLTNVHVGGIPRSADGGLSWRPTIAIDADVHQVRAHPTRPDIAIAASAAGLCVSRDGGVTWTILADGLHATHCSAVAFAGDDILISAATDQFAAESAVYRRPIDGSGPLSPLGGNAPRWFAGVVDTDCIATRGRAIAMIDHSGALYLSEDDGAAWSRPAQGLSAPSGLHIC